ncbi:MAG: DNA replication and repair protein RecF [Nitrospirae bacterium]|nr:DNA replication and repair protein RecF [Nitrospirota bacterium]MBI5695127.1 DNA replication and repair protein RecF [Nitrospirota bacterium]
MFLKSLSLLSIRNYSRLDVELGPGMNLFHGGNAQGKTNLLEAVSFLASLRSFRGVKAPALLAWGAAEGMVRGEVVREQAHSSSSRRLTVGISKEGRRVTLDGKKPGSVREYLLSLKVVSFSPEDLFLVREYPAHRRRFLDRSVFHAHPSYIDVVGRCAASVKQLNAALRAGDDKVMESWEELLVPLAAEVTLRRRERVAGLGPRAAALYDSTLGSGELGLTYRSQARGEGKDELESSYRELFRKKRAEGIRRGSCQAGPQFDDLGITLSGRDMRLTASRGQGRLALLALVLADAEVYRDEQGEYPVLLLDDVASELDVRRRDALMDYVSGMGQALLTSTDETLVSGRDCRLFLVEDTGDGAAIKL